MWIQTHSARKSCIRSRTTDARSFQAPAEHLSTQLRAPSSTMSRFRKRSSPRASTCWCQKVSGILINQFSQSTVASFLVHHLQRKSIEWAASSSVRARNSKTQSLTFRQLSRRLHRSSRARRSSDQFRLSRILMTSSTRWAWISQWLPTSASRQSRTCPLPLGLREWMKTFLSPRISSLPTSDVMTISETLTKCAVLEIMWLHDTFLCKFISVY